MVLAARAVLVACLAATVAGKPHCRLRKRGQFVVQPPLPTSPATPTTSHAPSPSATGGAGSDDEAELPPFDYEKNVIRGVNLGGWFVLEPWITPSVFEDTGNDAIIDEYTFGQLQPADVALAALTKHWESWYTEDEFKQISEAGLNHVRVPIGYWAVPMNQSVEPYVPGAYPYFKTALKWARKYGLHVIVDLHGAKGSQNGYDNSGQKRNDPQWANDPANLQHTVDVITYLSNDVGPSISIVQLLNEVAAYTSQQFLDATRQYWMDGYHAIRGAKAAGDRVQVMIGDGFQGLNAWQGFMQPPEYTGVSMDYHMYQVFSIRELSRNYDEHVAYACSLGPGLSDFSKSTMPAVVGEWSLAITDCTKWLNGRGVGVRWDGTYYPTADTVTLGSCEYLSMDYTKFDDAYKTFLRRYWEAQVHIGEAAGGWIFWTWKAEFSAEWSYKVGVEQGWIPQDPTNRLYPDICG